MDAALKVQWEEYLSLGPGILELSHVLFHDELRDAAWPLFLEKKPSTDIWAEVVAIEALRDAAWDQLLLGGPTNEDLTLVIRDIPVLRRAAWKLLFQKREPAADEFQSVLAEDSLWRETWKKFVACNPSESHFLVVLMDQDIEQNRELCILAAREAIARGLFSGDLERVLELVPEVAEEFAPLVERTKRREQLLIDMGVHQEQSDTCRLS